MRRFRVAHVITRLCKGGAQENTFHTVRLSNCDRFEVDLISGPTHGDEGSIEENVKSAGIGIIREPNLVRPVSPWRDIAALRGLTRLFSEKGYDIVHTHTSKAGFVGRFAAARAGVPIVVHTPHGNIFEGYFPGPVTYCFNQMERFAAGKTDRIIELTSGGIDEYLSRGIGRREQFVTIFSGIDLSPYEAARERRWKTREALGVPEEALLVGAVGRLEPIKGFSYFVSAARRLNERLPSLRFILAGQGSLAGALREEAGDLEGRFTLLGPRQDVPDLMAAMDVFVLTSINEGMGRVLLEAGAAGTPSVATRVGGVPDVINDGETGILVAPRDPEALADAVWRLIQDAGLREAMGRAARERVVPAYGLERMVERIETLYEELIKEKGLDA